MTPSLDEILDVCGERCRTMDAPLAVRLATYAAEVRRVVPDYADIVERMIARLEQAGVGKDAPQAGDPMPDFLLPDETGRLWSLDDLKARGPSVIVFHRGHWCPYCVITATALAQIHPRITALGGTLVAITPEIARFNAELKGQAAAPFPVLSDMDSGYALLLGLAYYVGDETARYMTDVGWGFSAFTKNDAWMLPVPATFVVGADGVVRERFIDPDFRRRMDVAEILGALTAISG